MCSEIELQTYGVDIIYFPKGSWEMEGRASVSLLPWSGGGSLFVTFLLQNCSSFISLRFWDHYWIIVISPSCSDD